jgi:hypothetical protein
VRKTRIVKMIVKMVVKRIEKGIEKRIEKRIEKMIEKKIEKRKARSIGKLVMNWIVAKVLDIVVGDTERDIEAIERVIGLVVSLYCIKDHCNKTYLRGGKNKYNNKTLFFFNL